jgi:hypothetical protein
MKFLKKIKSIFMENIALYILFSRKYYLLYYFKMKNFLLKIKKLFLKIFYFQKRTIYRNQ